MDLLKVGGVLVGPFENELLKITRLSATHYDTRALISVKFSPLVVPPPALGGRRSAADAVRGRPLCFQLQVWSPLSHAQYPDEFQRVAFELMATPDLPLCLWHEILSFTRHDWFDVAADALVCDGASTSSR